MALRVGVFLTSAIQAGGGFRLSLSTIVLLANATRLRHTFKFFTTNRDNVTTLRNLGIHATYIGYNPVRKQFSHFANTSRVMPKLNQLMSETIKLMSDQSLDGILQKKSIDLVYFLEPTDFPVYLWTTNYLTTVFDLCHHDVVEFPEVRRFFEAREKRYQSCLPRATAVITNWQSLVEEISRRYNVDRERIFVLPHLPQVAVQKHSVEFASANVGTKCHVPRPYIFYPANFWAHKNHVYILDALALLREKRGIVVRAAFCGVDGGNLGVVQRAMSRLQLNEQVHFLGLVGDNEICGLYERALALVMPTYFGPTNIPPLEAASFGCPIIYSDLEPFRQQFADGALYCDLSSPESLASQIERLIKEPDAATELARRAKALMPKDVEARYEETLGHIFDHYEYISKRWQ